MKKLVTTCLLISALAFSMAGNAPAAETKLPKETKAQHGKRMEWFREARFGMFIHWGLYAVRAGEWDGKHVSGAAEWDMNTAGVPLAEYEKVAGEFDPVKFDAKEWVRIAKNAGMKYIVITSKHHEGFSMFDSKVSDYNIVKATPFKRDPMKELAAACKKAGITFCFYHSIMDWHHPDAQGIGFPHYNDAPSNPNFPHYFENYLKPQIKELLSNYGPIGILWFDGEWIHDYTSDMGAELYAWCRTLQPNIIVNNRVGKERPGMEGLSDKPFVVGDYGTPEQQIPARGFGPGVDWESCMTMNDTWGFDKRDNHWKSATTMIRMLADCASKGGNLLMNVGPTGEGLIPAASVERLAEVGKWMEVNHEAIYDTTASPFKKLAFGKCTQKPGKLFLHVFDWPADGKLVVPISSKVKRAYLMGSRSKSFHVTEGATGAQIELPTTAPDAADSVIVLEIRGEPSVLEVGLTQAADGTIKLLAEDAEIQGSGLRLENRGGRPNVGFWGSASDYVQWPVQVNQPGTFRVEVTYACEPGSAGSEYSVVAGGSKVTGKVEATRDWDTFTAAQPGQIRLNQGKAIICVKPAGTKINGAGLMNLRSVVLRRENE